MELYINDAAGDNTNNSSTNMLPDFKLCEYKKDIEKYSD